MSIELSISPDNVKALCAIVNLLSKIGKELVIEVDRSESMVTLRALNDAKSSFVSVEFDVSFFTNFTATTPSFSCKLLSKPISTLLNNIKNIDILRIRSENVENECFLVFEIKMTNKIKRTHRFTYQDCEIINALFDEDESHFLQSVPKVFSNLLSHLHKAPEIIVDASPTTFTISSFHSDMYTESKQHLSTGLCIDVSEFDRYDFRSTEPTELICCSKELRSILSFCEATSLATFTLFFTTGGRPIKIKCDHAEYCVSLVQATMEPPRSRRLSQSDAHITRVNSATALGSGARGGGGNARGGGGGARGGEGSARGGEGSARGGEDGLEQPEQGYDPEPEQDVDLQEGEERGEEDGREGGEAETEEEEEVIGMTLAPDRELQTNNCIQNDVFVTESASSSRSSSKLKRKYLESSSDEDDN